MLDTIKQWVTLVRDIGLIIGIPILVSIGVRLYGLQLDALEEQKAIVEERNKLLKETQYDRALSLIRAQKELFEMERSHLEAELARAQSQTVMDQGKITALQDRARELETTRNYLGRIRIVPSSDGGFSVTTEHGTAAVRG